jgi:hypothetical protein
MYRQFGTLRSAPVVNGYSLGVGSDATSEDLCDVWDLEFFLPDKDVAE